MIMVVVHWCNICYQLLMLPRCPEYVSSQGHQITFKLLEHLFGSFCFADARDNTLFCLLCSVGCNANCASLCWSHHASNGCLKFSLILSRPHSQHSLWMQQSLPNSFSWALKVMSTRKFLMVLTVTSFRSCLFWEIFSMHPSSVMHYSTTDKDRLASPSHILLTLLRPWEIWKLWILSWCQVSPGTCCRHHAVSHGASGE